MNNPVRSLYITNKTDNSLSQIQKMMRSCIQCGTCTGSCPNASFMDYTPRKMWRMVMLGQKDIIFNSKTFIMCSSCYYCTLRCPRGLPLTAAMSALKKIAAEENFVKYKKSFLFYDSFMESVRRHGRVRETEFMTLYFTSMKNPILPFSFAPLGMKLMLKRKLPIQFPSKGDGALDAIFKKADELEGMSS
jgi:heterodisulfide reductase subunit C2